MTKTITLDYEELKRLESIEEELIKYKKDNLVFSQTIMRAYDRNNRPYQATSSITMYNSHMEAYDALQKSDETQTIEGLRNTIEGLKDDIKVLKSRTLFERILNDKNQHSLQNNEPF